MNNYVAFFSGLAVMAGVTYLVRMLPLVLVKKKIENKFINSFLYYVPYAVLAVMTVPAIFSSTASLPSAIAGFAVALVLDVSTIDVNYVKKLYREAFPLRERIPFSKLLKLQKNGIIRILAAYENGEPCGLAVACTGSKSVLLMYLAVDGNKRGQGLGSKIMPALCDTFPRRNLLLEIEKPDESKPMTVRRKEFYLRCGLHDAGVDILLAGVPMEILMTGDGEFDKYEYIGIYHKHVGKTLTKLFLKIK